MEFSEIIRGKFLQSFLFCGLHCIYDMLWNASFYLINKILTVLRIKDHACWSCNPHMFDDLSIVIFSENSTGNGEDYCCSDSDCFSVFSLMKSGGNNPHFCQFCWSKHVFFLFLLGYHIVVFTLSPSLCSSCLDYDYIFSCWHLYYGETSRWQAAF